MILATWPLLIALGTPQTIEPQAAPENEQATEEKESGPAREGFLIGFTLGSGRFDCDACESDRGTALEFHLGGALSERAALMFSVATIGRTDRGNHLQSSKATLTGQYWVHPRLWFSGGVGFGGYSLVDNTRRYGSESSVAWAGGTGVEVVQSGRFALDLRVRYNYLTKFSTDDLTVQVGFTWY
jgi:hypothetical protein